MIKFKSNAAKDATRKHVKNEPNAHLAGSHDESNWLISYADMMTLLCGFFIMLFSMAKLDNPKYDAFKSEISKQFGGEYVSATKELAMFATQIIQELGVEKTAIIKSDYNGVSITFESTVFFDTLSAQASTEGTRILKQLIAKVAARQRNTGKTYKIIAEGHTDGRPVTGGEYPSNWELSGARAARVVRLFLDAGFAPDQMAAIGYADTRPLVPARSASGTWDIDSLAKNRRVVLRIMEPSVDSIPYPDAPSSGAQASENSASTAPAPLTAPAPATPTAPVPTLPVAPTAPANSTH